MGDRLSSFGQIAPKGEPDDQGGAGKTGELAAEAAAKLKGTREQRRSDVPVLRRLTEDVLQVEEEAQGAWRGRSGGSSSGAASLTQCHEGRGRQQDLVLATELPLRP